MVYALNLTPNDLLGVEIPKSLGERGISYQESALAQKIAALPDDTKAAIKEGVTKLNAALRSIEEDKRKEDLQRSWIQTEEATRLAKRLGVPVDGESLSRCLAVKAAQP
jgi:hypothetical protein